MPKQAAKPTHETQRGAALDSLDVFRVLTVWPSTVELQVGRCLCGINA